MATVPIFSPNGELGDIPAEQLAAAVKSGAKLGVTMTGPDGSNGVIPADRVQDAVKAGGKLVPLKEQETQHPGFWHALGSDLMAMLPDFKNPKANPYGDEQPLPGRVVAGVRQAEMEDKQQAADDAARKAAGYSDTYTALAPVAEGLGANVHGMEESAKEGDTSGVLGHAAAVPVAMAATAGVTKGAGVVAKAAPAAAKASLRMVSSAARSLPDSAPDFVGMASPRLAHGLRVLQKIGNVADKIAQSKPEKLAPELTTPARTLPGQISPEVTRPAAAAPAEPIPQRSGLALPPAPEGAELGEIPYTGKSAAQSGEALATKPKTIDLTKSPEAAAVVRFSKADLKAASDLLHSATSDLVDEVIPPDKSYGPNLATKSRVEFYLQRGDVANAEKSLDAGAKQANADYQPFYRDPKPVPSTNEIRARVQAEAKAPKVGTRADLMDDKAVDQEWGWHLERHGWSAASEARREFIARNSTGMTKGELARKFAEERSGTAAQPAAAPASAAPADDLTSILQKSLEQARKKKAQ